MKIVFLDAKSIGDDIDLSGFDQLGEVVKYGFSTPEEAGERTRTQMLSLSIKYRSTSRRSAGQIT